MRKPLARYSPERIAQRSWSHHSPVKPTGDTLFDYHYHENFYTGYFVGTPDEFQEYRIDLTLPAGSPPGTWVLSEMVVRDKAGNTLTSNFIETGIIRPIQVLGDEAPRGPAG